MTTTQQDTTNTTAQFEVGEFYTTGHGDYSWTYEVVRRTAKFVTLRDTLSGETVRVGVEMHYTGRCETCLPHGRYSMAAVLNADDIVIATDEEIDAVNAEPSSRVATFTMRATPAGMTATCDRCQASVIGDRTDTGAFCATHTCETIR